MKKMLEKENGITIVVLVITIVIMLIIAGVSMGGGLKGHKESQDAADLADLKTVQNAIYQRYTKVQLTGNLDDLPGTTISKDDVQKIVDEINSQVSQENQITLKGTEYKRLEQADLDDLDISNTKSTFIVNYKTGEVLNETKKVTYGKKALYIYSKTEE